MTKKELELLLKVLEKIKNPDTYVMECIHNVKGDLLVYERRKGQLREMAELDYPW
jgi:hypothetical protein